MMRADTMSLNEPLAHREDCAILVWYSDDNSDAGDDDIVAGMHLGNSGATESGRQRLRKLRDQHKGDNHGTHRRAVGADNRGKERKRVS